MLSAWEPEEKPQRITVASTGALPEPGKGGGAEKDVQRILDHWKAEFAKMLVDKPDLILVPEVCDSPGYANNTPPQNEYYKVRGQEPEKSPDCGGKQVLCCLFGDAVDRWKGLQYAGTF